MGFVGGTSRLFMFGANSTEVHGLDGFLRTLDRRKDPTRRERGLITGMPAHVLNDELTLLTSHRQVSNHTCVYVRIAFSAKSFGIKLTGQD